MACKTSVPMPRHGRADKHLFHPADHTTKAHGPAECNQHIAQGRPLRANQPDSAQRRPFEQGGGHTCTMLIVIVQAAFFVIAGHQRQKPLVVFRAAKVNCSAHKRANLSVRRAKKPSAFRLPMNIALGLRSVTRHQSATVMPRVRSDWVSISTFTWRPSNRSGWIR
jgi:hypothetical protein